ncbi:conserved exported hypothetical protein [Frankia canadensis]|uniref:Uncharacterized protein n=1 Tax=Frankia canadensis TaxID=1836972 RepID=A0A2I2L1X9_9ACTN|nr:hypothetical protein [Frankia canadensis]SNQ51867.1 conserved exported hypothetical protein [Frankia canadensis]SOU59157.1 conserved exported hypothetical protein [Frankia canadensis]
MLKINKGLLAAASLALACVATGPFTGTASAAPCPPPATGYSTSFDGHLYSVDLNQLKISGTISGFDGSSNSYVSHDGRSVYVDNWGAGTVQVMDTCTRQITASINVNGPVLGATSPDGRYLYEAGYQGLFETGRDTTLYVIDSTTNTIVRSWPVKDSFAVTVSPDGKKVYVAGVDDVVVYDTAGNRLDSLATGHLPEWISITPNGRLLVSGNYDGTVTVTNLATRARLATVDFGATSAPEYVAVTPDGTQAWVTLGIGGVGVINLTTFAAKVLPTSGMALTVTFSTDGQRAYVTEGGPNTVNDDGVDATARAVSGQWHPGPGNIRVFHVPTQRVIRTIQAGEFPGNVAFQP